MTFDLKPVLKALLFSTSSSLDIKDIQAVFTRFHQQHGGAEGEEEAAEETAEADPDADADGWRPEDVPSLITVTQIREAVEAVNADLEERHDVYRIVEAHDGFRMTTDPRYATWVRLLREEPRQMRLSQAALETLAIVAYRQPVTRSEMESIRGVSVDGALNRLIERELVEVIGRADLPGRPIQYGTTERFLEFVGIRTLEELPASDVLSQRQIDEWLREAAEGHHPGDRDVGLPEEPGDGEPVDSAEAGSSGDAHEDPSDEETLSLEENRETEPPKRESESTNHSTSSHS
jgi:segregation and condensation protein B